jgi:hypothetical protein
MEALKLVPAAIAVVYEVLPLTFHDGVLTVAVSERRQFALDDVKNFTGVRELRSVVKPIDEIEDGIAKAYA